MVRKLKKENNLHNAKKRRIILTRRNWWWFNDFEEESWDSIRVQINFLLEHLKNYSKMAYSPFEMQIKVTVTKCSFNFCFKSQRQKWTWPFVGCLIIKVEWRWFRNRRTSEPLDHCVLCGGSSHHFHKHPTCFCSWRGCILFMNNSH